MSDIEKVLHERGKRYGEYPDHALITQDIKRAIHSGRSWDDCNPHMQETLEMIAHKIGRIVNGDPYYVDSWTDIIGYARLTEKELLGCETHDGVTEQELENEQLWRNLQPGQVVVTNEHWQPVPVQESPDVAVLIAESEAFQSYVWSPNNDKGNARKLYEATRLLHRITAALKKL